ncbi:MAG: sulfurtransferase TusA family protein [Candidatus Neomarinimicrobiota bacterium]
MGDSFKLNCEGFVCPIPVAKTKKMMNQMERGDVLEISGDFCEAGEIIKRYVESHGGKVIEFDSEGDNYCLKIEKL